MTGKHTIPFLIRLGLAATLCLAGHSLGVDAPSPTPVYTQSALVTPQAPLLTPQREHELFDALDLSSDALNPVAAAVAKGDYPAAEHALAEYFRHRASPAWTCVPRNPLLKDPIAEAAVEGGDIPPWHTFPDNKIDWLYNPTYHTPGLAPNYGWQAMLCRMSFWANLGNAYRATGDERYTQAWIKQFHSFITECPPPDLSGKTKPVSWVKMDDGMEIVQPLAWGSLEVGIRMSYGWPAAFFSFLPSTQFSDEDIALYLDSCVAQARYLEKYNTAIINNRVTMEMTGLYTIGAFFPEFKDAGQWRKYAVNRMHDAEDAQFLPDGAQDELSTMYHNTALNSFLDIAEIARRVGRMDEFPAGYIGTLEKAFDYDLYLMTPDGKFPEFNDGLTYHLAAEFKKALEYFPNRPEYQWGASNGKEGHPPAETSHAFPWAGFYVMRSGWEQDANYFVLRAGPLGVSHAHQDKLNVILWPYGRELLYNGGGATYEQSKRREFSIETFSKNTVLVDGKPQDRDRHNPGGNVSKTPINARWESTPDHDFAAGVYDEGYGSLTSNLAVHTRRVLFVKPDLFVIADTLSPTDGAEHTYQARWNLLTTHTKEDPVTHAVTTTDENKPNLVLLPLQPDHLEVRSVTAQTEPELLGWSIRREFNSIPVPATTVVHTKKASGTQSFLTLLVPIRKGCGSPVKSVKPEAPDSATVTFNDGRVVLITANPDSKGGIEVVEPNRDVKVTAASR